MEKQMNGTKSASNGRMFTTILITVVSGLMVIGIAAIITLMIGLNGRVSSLETTVTSMEKRIAKIEGDIYTPRFSENKRNGRLANGPEKTNNDLP